MENIILLAHVLIAVIIIGLILMQRGKGAEMGASFGSGASQTLFGASGSGNFFAKMTALFAAIFFVTSFALAVIAKHRGTVEEDFLPSVQEESNAIPEDEINDNKASSLEESSDTMPPASQEGTSEEQNNAVNSEESEQATDAIPEEAPESEEIPEDSK